MKPAAAADGETAKDAVVDAPGNLNDATKQQCRIAEVLADRGYHNAETQAWLDEREVRSYIPPRNDNGSAAGMTR